MVSAEVLFGIFVGGRTAVLTDSVLNANSKSILSRTITDLADNGLLVDAAGEREQLLEGFLRRVISSDDLQRSDELLVYEKGPDPGVLGPGPGRKKFHWVGPGPATSLDPVVLGF